MVKSKWIAFSILLVCMAQAQKVTLSQGKVVELILQNSLVIKESGFKYEQYRYLPYLVMRDFDWKWSVETGMQVDKTETLSLVGDYRYERHKTMASISKSLLTGTNLIFDVARTSQNQTISANQLTFDTWGLSVEQSLWGNSFGQGDRARMRAAENLYKSQILGQSDEIQNVVLQGLRLYWDVYVAQENFNEAQGARERYRKLVSNIQKKSTLSYTSPGELNQVQAEFELREQNIKTGTNEFFRLRESLTTFLNLPPKTEIQFEIPKSIPTVPVLPPKEAKQVRAIQAQELKVRSAEDDLKYIDSKNDPSLNLVARMSSSGVDESSSESFNELTSGSRTNTYVGLKISHSFGSDAKEEERLNKKALLELEKIRQQRSLLDFDDRQIQSQRKVETAFQVLESINKQKAFREKALTELNRSYTQGRTDIRNLIEAMNSYNLTEVARTKAVGDYFMALNEWYALRDELITVSK
jgi:outer membrane protein TolC